MKFGDIVKIIPIQGEIRGLADKWVITFSTGHEAMAKPVERWSFLEQVWPVVVSSSRMGGFGWSAYAQWI